MFEFFRPDLWILLLIVFAGIEGLTAGLVSIWFCLGSIAALLACWAGGSAQVQIAVFAVVSILAMAAIRPLAKKYLIPKKVATNADRILGQDGIVVQRVDNLNGQGEIRIGGASWTARSLNGEILEEGTVVRIERIEGVKAIVTPAKEGEADV